MIKKLYKVFLLAIVASISLISFSSCKKEYITEQPIVNEYNEYYEGAFVHREFITVAPAQWTWNPNIGSFEYYVSIDKLNEKDIYDNGAMVASIFINPGQADERQEMLPYVNTYELVLDGEPYKYTETMSCTFVRGGVWLYLQASDLEGDPAVLSDYQYKISIFWD